jgi:hypothetical protein
MIIENQIKGRDQGLHIEDTEKTYRLTCEVKKKIVTRVNNGNRYEMRMIYLVPQMSGEMIKFYDAYLPEYVVEVDNNELVFLNMKSGKAFRGFLSPSTKDIPERHIFIMTNSESDFLDSIFVEKMKIKIDCIPFSEHKDFDV